jgi:rhamnose utilization protein RhaD (predicted bifunctional aldolase and dehydrogenase)
LPWRVVAHTHSIATLAHAVSAHGRTAAMAKLVHLPAVLVPYAKPGLPLTQGIMARMTADTRVFILENHGLICCGNSVDETADLLAQVEACLALPARKALATPTQTAPPAGYVWAREGWIAQNPAVCALAVAGSYYPDHVVFLGPALPVRYTAQNPPAVVFPGTGIARRIDASASQRAMLRCLSDLLSRLPADWSPLPIGAQAEAELLNWDAEKYRQALAARA